MSKVKKCLYLIDLLFRRGPMSLKDINERYLYSSIYEGVKFFLERLPVISTLSRSTSRAKLSIIKAQNGIRWCEKNLSMARTSRCMTICFKLIISKG